VEGRVEGAMKLERESKQESDTREGCTLLGEKGPEKGRSKPK
jgi:hypothetical protein